MKGIYILVLSIQRATKLPIGRLDSTAFEKGIYACVGSAQNNWEKRVERHCRRTKKRFWHIDYLLGDQSVSILSAYLCEAPRGEECRVALAISSIGTPIKGFGSSDCRCASHLLQINNSFDFKKLMKTPGFITLNLSP